eukprot:GEMP01067527.1.p1 GENE.GEMP01067527.1~~GEMP01067527.1.p1  ORF type:complete len:215 (+),score=31.93 GEMP01067527.1:91-735(+)
MFNTKCLLFIVIAFNQQFLVVNAFDGALGYVTKVIGIQLARPIERDPTKEYNTLCSTNKWLYPGGERLDHWDVCGPLMVICGVEFLGCCVVTLLWHRRLEDSHCGKWTWLCYCCCAVPACCCMVDGELHVYSSEHSKAVSLARASINTRIVAPSCTADDGDAHTDSQRSIVGAPVQVLADSRVIASAPNVYMSNVRSNVIGVPVRTRGDPKDVV